MFHRRVPRDIVAAIFAARVEMDKRPRYIRAAGEIGGMKIVLSLSPPRPFAYDRLFMVVAYDATGPRPYSEILPTELTHMSESFKTYEEARGFFDMLVVKHGLAVKED